MFFSNKELCCPNCGDKLITIMNFDVEEELNFYSKDSHPILSLEDVECIMNYWKSPVLKIDEHSELNLVFYNCYNTGCRSTFKSKEIAKGVIDSFNKTLVEMVR